MASPDPTQGFTAFRVHAQGCVRCEIVRRDIARNSFAVNFDLWHLQACRRGQELLEQWKYACDSVILEGQRDRSRRHRGAA